MTPPVISVCILAGHGKAALRACLASLQDQVAPPAFELLVGGRSTSELLAVVSEYFPRAQVCNIGRRLPGAARNPLVERADGELLLFLDDDVIAPPNLLRDLALTAARHPESSVFGGPNETPLGSSTFQVVQGAVLSSLVGSGPVSRRYGPRHACSADERWFTLCNLAIRRKVMSPFLGDLVCAEENALLTELHGRGEKMRYDPCLRVFHSRRPTWRTFARQMFKYGRGRGELVRRSPAAAHVAYAAPAALLLYVPVLLMMITLGKHQNIWLVPIGVYGLLIGASGLRIGFTLRNVRYVLLAITLTVTVHVCYGAGLLRGLWRPGVAPSDDAARWVTAPPPAWASAGQQGDYARAGAAQLDCDSD